MFEVGPKIHGLVYDSRDLRCHAVDVRFADVRIEDPLQHHRGRLHRLGWRADQLERFGAVYHARIARDGT